MNTKIFKKRKLGEISHEYVDKSRDNIIIDSAMLGSQVGHTQRAAAPLRGAPEPVPITSSKTRPITAKAA